MQKISIIGLGKVGLPLAAAIASRGYHILGYDNDASKLEKIRKNIFSYEPHLDELMRQHARRLQCTGHLSEIAGTAITFVAVPTPSIKNGAFSLRHLDHALAKIGAVLKSKKEFHIVSVVSTVLPGSMEKLRKVIEKSSGKKCGRDFGLCYNPAFIALGNVIYNFLHPDFVLIGESDKPSGDKLEEFYLHFCKNDAKIHRMNFINAEITKISVNTFITMKISFGNTIARLCEQIPGAHSEVITRAIGADRRIGTHYLKGALGYGGPCFPRDNKAFAYMAKQVGIKALSAEATHKINLSQIEWLSSFVMSKIRKEDTIAILGLSYKPDTDVIEESQGIALAQALLRRNCRLVLYDPAAMSSASRIFEGKVTFAKNLDEALRRSQIIVITTPWNEFANIHPRNFASTNGHPKIVLDCWRILEDKNVGQKAHYIPLGVSLAGREGI